ncbi:cytochrome d ubiquinol oxidase subunit II [Tuberibacillus sp. Marseille-P3662]|uniref:cytochrome d ubiquinol oxidase subunit II n=1 Tax=Tuberibacillus sp. Marseille-P3662 TaxID=1965358 RepID=UPI000A1CBFA1|nr:cytochrome d ubiquinol oxidase subunit II [Tuberibacillus sp. Marseille-P3662]
MTNEALAITILWSFIFVYAVAASIDFGSGFWSMIYQNRRKMSATNIANRFLSPSWEVTNVFIVLIVVALFSYFPGASYALGSLLLIPGSVVLLLLSIRSGFMVFAHSVQNEHYKKVMTLLSGTSGFLIPILLILVLPIINGSFIQVVNDVQLVDFNKLLTSLSFVAFAGFAITNTLFLSSLLLADYSHVADDEEAYHTYRRDAMILGPFTFILTGFILYALNQETHWLYDQLMDLKPYLVLAAVMFVLGYGMLWVPSKRWEFLGRPRLAVIGVVLQYLFAGYAYGQAQYPYIIHPYITISEGFTDPATFRALSISYLIGFLILFPGFILFWRMFMSDRRYVKSNRKD